MVPAFVANYSKLEQEEENRRFFPQEVLGPDQYRNQLKRLDFLEGKESMREKIRRIQLEQNSKISRNIASSGTTRRLSKPDENNTVTDFKSAFETALQRGLITENQI